MYTAFNDVIAVNSVVPATESGTEGAGYFCLFGDSLLMFTERRCLLPFIRRRRSRAESPEVECRSSLNFSMFLAEANRFAKSANFLSGRRLNELVGTTHVFSTRIRSTEPIEQAEAVHRAVELASELRRQSSDLWACPAHIRYMNHRAQYTE